MFASVTVDTRLNTVQNSLAAAVFLFLLAAQSLAYLLYCNPGSELLWALSIPLNRMAAPVLDPFDALLQLGPLVSMALFGAAAAVPVLSQLCRDWLGTSASGHVALAVSTILTAGAMQRAQSREISANLSPIFDPSAFDMSSTGLAVATAALVVLCALNHVVFFVRARGK